MFPQNLKLSLHHDHVISPLSHLVKDCSGFLPFMLASGMRMKSLPSVLQVLAVLQSLLQPTPFRSQPSGDLVGLNLQSGQVRSGQVKWFLLETAVSDLSPDTDSVVQSS